MSSGSASPPSRYRIMRRLGVGGMGEVFLAEDTQLERWVAVKILSAELAQDETQRQRFRTEAKAASGLVHPNICVIHEVGETEDGRPFLAMEYVEGQALDKVLRERRLRLRESIKIGIEVAEALSLAHARHIIHRDIKPANIIIDTRGHAKVLDFGLAKRLAEEETTGGAVPEPHTQTGALLGTPHYMSPEQALGRELDARTDIFSLGAVLYESVAGQRAFQGCTFGDTIDKVINRRPAPLQLDNPLFSPALDDIIFKCLEKNPDQRYASATELVEALTKLDKETELATLSRPRTEVLAAPETPERPRLWSRAAAVFRRANLVRVSVAVALTTLLLAGGWVVLRDRFPRKSGGAKAEATPKSIAVLPFANFSPEEDTDYLSDGLTEEISSTLSRLPGLRVAARNSAFAFKGKQENARVIGKALGVSTLLEGSIRKVGNQLRVIAQLVKVDDGFQLWSETYDRPLDDILKVQEEIAHQIAARLSAGGGTGPGRKAIRPEAHRFYLQARQHWNRRTEAGLTNAIHLFLQAIRADGGYAEAQAGLAASYLLLPNYAPVKRNQYSPLARIAANRALELDPACPEAHAVLAQLQWAAHDLAGAEQHFRRALQLDPNYATAHHWYGQFLTVHGRGAEGLPLLESAVRLDPLSPVIRTAIPEWYYLTGDVDRAIVEARALSAAFPDFLVGRIMLSYALMRKGLFTEALEQLDTARALEPENSVAYLDVKAYALARSGREKEARDILAVFERCRLEGKQVEAPLSLIYQGLREYDRTLDALESLAAADDLGDAILCDPCFAELHTLPRFKSLLQKAGLNYPYRESQ